MEEKTDPSTRTFRTVKKNVYNFVKECKIYSFIVTYSFCYSIFFFSLSGGVATWMGKSTPISESSRAGWNSELLVPLPVPHPVLICILIYNRHRDVGAIPLESESCRLLIRYLEGSVTPSSRMKE